MQVFVKDAVTLAFDVEDGCTVEQLKMQFTQRAFGVDAAASWMLLHNGRQLPDDAPLAAAGVEGGATLHATSRVRGGGGDGGSTGAESRSCYLEMYQQKKADKVDPAEELLARWSRCHLSGENLVTPVVADELGFLYNKEALVRALLNKTMPASLGHISGLKALVPVKTESARGSSSSSSSSNGAAKSGPGAGNGATVGAGQFPFQCPVTGGALNGRGKAWVHRASGWLISDKALREVPAAAEELLGGKWSNSDLLLVNPAGEDLEQARARLMVKLAGSKKVKKAQKRSAEAAAAAAGGAAVAAAAAAAGEGAGQDAAGGEAPAKRVKVPEGATPAVWKSLFGDGKPVQETYCCRSVSGRTAY